ncbi:hypothetical protein GQ42DRAFT_29336 [Ramicandelaber brevisporus]|nr:hypothetical protein GQ42DRAFT_29336 [Ramicandelaber brevisporus]
MDRHPRLSSFTSRLLMSSLHTHSSCAEYTDFKCRCVAACGIMVFIRWAYGQMDKAPDYGSGDSRFDPWYARSFVCSLTLASFFCLFVCSLDQ